MNIRANKLLVSISSGLIGRGIGLIAPLIVMAPMRHYLGANLFGMWLTTTALVAMASFLDFGIGNAALTRLSNAFGREDDALVRQILGEAYALLILISSSLIILLFLISEISQLIFKFGQTDDYLKIIQISLLSLFISFPSSLISRILQSKHAFIQSQISQAVGPIFAIFTCLGSIKFGISPLISILFYCMSGPVTLLFWTFFYFAFNINHRPQVRSIDWSSARRLLTLGSEFFILSIFSLTGMNADNVVIGAKLGPAIVAEYGVPARLGSISMLLVGTVFMPLWPLFGDALARRDQLWLRATAQRMSQLGALSILVFGAFIVAFANPIMIAWMKQSYADQALILAGWSALATVVAITAPYNMILNAAGDARSQIIPWALFVLVSILAKLIILTDENVWLCPWISAATYAIFVSIQMISKGREQLAR